MTSGNPLRRERWPSTLAKSRSWVSSDFNCRSAASTDCRPLRTSVRRSVSFLGFIRFWGIFLGSILLRFEIFEVRDAFLQGVGNVFLVQTVEHMHVIFDITDHLEVVLERR